MGKPDLISVPAACYIGEVEKHSAGHVLGETGDCEFHCLDDFDVCFDDLRSYGMHLDGLED